MVLIVKTFSLIGHVVFAYVITRATGLEDNAGVIKLELNEFLSAQTRWAIFHLDAYMQSCVLCIF